MDRLFARNEMLGFWIYRVQTQGSALLWRRFRSAGHNVTPEQFWLLTRLGERQGVNQRELGETMLKDRHNMTRLLNIMEKRGYVERRPDAADKRVFRLFLTDNGRVLQEKLRPLVLQHVKQVFRGITPEDYATARGILEHVAGNIEEALRHASGGFQEAGGRGGRDEDEMPDHSL